MDRNDKGQFLKKKWTMKICPCGNSFQVTPCRGEKAKFCSKSCKGKFEHIGKRFSEETKRRLSISHKGQVSWNKGKCSPVTTEQLLLAKERSQTMCWHTWRKLIYKMQGRECQFCKSTEKLEVHHIERSASNPEKKFCLDNGIVLCEKCHDATFNQEEVYVLMCRMILHLRYGIVFEETDNIIKYVNQKCGFGGGYGETSPVFFG